MTVGNLAVTDLSFAPAAPPRGVLAVSGEDRVGFLQGLVSNDMLQVGERTAIWAALLTPQGKYLHDFFVAEAEGTVLIEAEAARLADLQRRLSMFKLRSKVTIQPAAGSLEVWLGWGDGAAARLGLAAPGDAMPIPGGVVFADPRLAELGIRVIAPPGTAEKLLAAHGFARSDAAGWDRLRLGLGVPDGSRDLAVEKSILLENGFDELRGVSWNKGCYMGQELTARTKYRGLVKKRLMPLAIEGAPPEPGTLVTRPDGSEAGEIRSGREGMALGLIRLDALDAPLTVDGAPVRPIRPAWARW
jgi:folate-binding protein YgfZ